LAAFMKFWPIIHLAISLFILWVCWSLRQLAIQEVNKIVSAAVAALTKTDDEAEEAIDDHEGRLTRVEKDVEQIRTDLNDLPTMANFKELSGEMKVVAKGVEQLQKGVNRIENHFMEEGMKGAKS